MAVHRVINEDVLQRWQSEMDQYVNDKWKTIVPGVSYYFSWFVAVMRQAANV